MTAEPVRSTNPQSSTLPSSWDRARRCAQTASDHRGREIIVLDMRPVVAWVDFLVIVTGSSRRQLLSISEEIEKSMRELGDRAYSQEGREAGAWVVLDFEDIMIHLFDETKRAHYQIEHLWANAPVVDWNSPTPTPIGENAS